MTTLFEERHFSWPRQPGNPKREAKLPWFWFTDVGEAKSYLRLWWLWQVFGVLLFINVWFVKNQTVGWILFGLLLAAQAAFMRVWIPLCRRATPSLGPWDWFGGGWHNPKSRHCLMTAWHVVSESQQAEAAKR